jgi:hypothetical protein
MTLAITYDSIKGWGERNGFPHAVAYEANDDKLALAFKWLSAEYGTDQFRRWSFPEGRSVVLFRSESDAFAFKIKFG